MPRRTKEEAEKTRQEILFSALDIFYEKGYSKTTFDEIAKRINLTKGAVYWHFRNKPDIIAALIKESFNRTNEAIARKVPVVNALSDLRAHFNCLAELVRDNPNYRKFMFFMLFQMEWSETLFTHIGSSVKEIRDFPLNIIRQALTNSQKSGEIICRLEHQRYSHNHLQFMAGYAFLCHKQQFSGKFSALVLHKFRFNSKSSEGRKV